MSYTATRSGALSLAVKVNAGHIIGSPFSVTVQALAFNASTSRLSGTGLSIGMTSTLSPVSMVAFDAFGNTLWR